MKSKQNSNSILFFPVKLFVKLILFSMCLISIKYIKYNNLSLINFKKYKI